MGKKQFTVYGNFAYFMACLKNKTRKKMVEATYYTLLDV
jgi:hypothetical protein